MPPLLSTRTAILLTALSIAEYGAVIVNLNCALGEGSDGTQRELVIMGSAKDKPRLTAPERAERESDWLRIAREKIAWEDWDLAVAALDQAIKESPRDEQALLLRAMAQERLGHEKAALADYDRALKLMPKWPLALLHSGNLLVRSGEVKRGLKRQQEAICSGKISDGPAEFVLKRPSSEAVLRFVFVSPGDGIVGFDDQTRLDVVKKTGQVFFGHNASPAQPIHMEQGFFILDREVTVKQYAVFGIGLDKAKQPETKSDNANRNRRGAIASDRPAKEENTIGMPPPNGNSRPTSPALQTGDSPASNLSWVEADHWCRQLQAELGLVIRLPTEIEWEYAARANRHRVDPELDEEPGDSETQPNAQARPWSSVTRDISWVGAHDLAGNLSEWCDDTYRQSLFEKPVECFSYHPLKPVVSPSANPSKSTSSEWVKRLEKLEQANPRLGKQTASVDRLDEPYASVAKSYRGGAFCDQPYNCLLPVRRSAMATERRPMIGFRPVILLKEAK